MGELSEPTNIKHGVLRLGLVVHGVEAGDVLQEAVQVGVGAGEARGRSVALGGKPWVYGDLEQGLEETLEDVLEVLHTIVGPEKVQVSRKETRFWKGKVGRDV